MNPLPLQASVTMLLLLWLTTSPMRATFNINNNITTHELLPIDNQFTFLSLKIDPSSTTTMLGRIWF
jgi:hypothetical protein